MKLLRKAIGGAVPVVARVPMARRVLWWAKGTRARRGLDTVEQISVGFPRNLRRITAQELRAALVCGEDDCAPLDTGLGMLQGVGPVGGVNPGDRAALAHLVLRFRPRRVLEVGTHIGSSTASIALALEMIGGNGMLDTVDIEDVNDPQQQRWVAFGADRSPLQTLRFLGVEGRVRFTTTSSLVHLARTQARYDFVFLDGDHTAAAVYREIPAVLERLEEGGMIVLHDYFPDGRPLWSDGLVEPGPWLAIRRHEAEGGGLEAVPLGALPWRTKLGSNTTSLAVISRTRDSEL